MAVWPGPHTHLHLTLLSVCVWKQKETRAAQIADLKEKLGRLREDSIMKIRMLEKETTAKLNATQRLQKQRIRSVLPSLG